MDGITFALVAALFTEKDTPGAATFKEVGAL
jgi:hypothetical protein